MQWFIDIIKDWVIAQAYATEAWVIAQTYTTKQYVDDLIVFVLKYISDTICDSTARVSTGSTQSISSGIWTQIHFDTEHWDEKEEFASHKFTAKEAGYFQVNLSVMIIDPGENSRIDCAIKKNGGWHSVNGEFADTTRQKGSRISDIVHLDGDTDYLDFWVYQDWGAARNLISNPAYCFVSIHQLSKD